MKTTYKVLVGGLAADWRIVHEGDDYLAAKRAERAARAASAPGERVCVRAFQGGVGVALKAARS